MKKEEMYDILDNKRKVIGKASWSEVHKNGLRHQVVACFVFKDKDRKEILMQRRGFQMDQDPGKWNHSAGGHVLSGEKPLDAIKRELKEELFEGGIMPNIKISKIIIFINHDIPKNNEIFNLYEAYYTGPILHQKEEIKEVKWMGFEKLKEDLMVHPKKYTVSFKNALMEYLKCIREVTT